MLAPRLARSFVRTRPTWASSHPNPQSFQRKTLFGIRVDENERNAKWFNQTPDLYKRFTFCFGVGLTAGLVTNAFGVGI